MEAAGIEPAQHSVAGRSVGRLLAQRELDDLLPGHRLPFLEGGAPSRLAESGAGCAEVALAPCLEDSRASGYAELLPLGVDSCLEAEGVFVSINRGLSSTVLARLMGHESR